MTGSLETPSYLLQMIVILKRSSWVACLKCPNAEPKTLSAKLGELAWATAYAHGPL